MTIAAMVVSLSAGYEVKRGDTLAEIARQHGTTVSALVEANNLTNPDRIYAGQVLTIPDQEGSTSTSYRVMSGDSLARIARAHGVTVAALIQANNLANPDLIRIGQELLIPTNGSAAKSKKSEQAVVHQVAPGETLASIAARYGTTAEAIAAANGITDLSRIYSGTTLIVNGPPAAVLPEQTTGVAGYTVQAGDTLAAIARRFDTTVSNLAQRNSISNPNRIRIGQVLEVPANSWVCPVKGARYFNDWGFPRPGGRIHQGNDLFASRGTEVRAPVSGVVEPRSGAIGGLQFWLTGDDGHTYVGTHLEAFGKSGRVSAGDVVGYVGSSGNAVGSSPHLHFEIHVDGTPVNPYPTLRANGC